MIAFPNCKINLGLHVLQKRSDGFHDIETVFYPLPYFDALELMQTTTDSENLTTSIAITTYGLPIEGSVSDNLCIKAYQLLKQDFPHLPPVQVYLLKHIPMGAGLGGGSSNGACMLQMLNHHFKLGIPENQLALYALQLGSDCPFFLLNKCCYATGRGELLEEIKIDLSGYQAVLLQPGIHINTGWAFSQIKVAGSKVDQGTIKQIIKRSPHSWRNSLMNDFEIPVFEKYPLLKAMKDNLYDQGAVYASMSGSGSIIYGLFEKSRSQKLSFSLPHTAINL